jgi:hypothetical protein
VAFIKRDEQLGDILTKALTRIKFQELCGKIGLHMEVRNRLQELGGEL